jgi:hypothetical protein
MVSFRSTLVLLALISVASAGPPKGTKARMALKANLENLKATTLEEAAPYLRKVAGAAQKATVAKKPKAALKSNAPTTAAPSKAKKIVLKRLVKGAAKGKAKKAIAAKKVIAAAKKPKASPKTKAPRKPVAKLVKVAAKGKTAATKKAKVTRTTRKPVAKLVKVAVKGKTAAAKKATAAKSKHGKKDWGVESEVELYFDKAKKKKASALRGNAAPKRGKGKRG